MLDCLYKALLREEGATHLEKKQKFKIRTVIKSFCNQGMPPKEIHKDYMETLGKESPSYSTVKNWAAEFKRGEREHRG